MIMYDTVSNRLLVILTILNNYTVAAADLKLRWFYSMCEIVYNDIND